MSPAEALQENAALASRLLKVMSNENRLMILCTLVEKPLSVSALNKLIPLSQSALSQHLNTLREAQLVNTKKEGVSVIYSLNGSQSIKIIHTLKEIFCPEEEI